MLSKTRIADQLKKINCDEPQFFYRTKTILYDELTTVYLIFVPNFVVLAKTDPRNVERDDLKFIEKVKNNDITFFKEDNMYLLMKWKDRHLLIGFKNVNILMKFCDKINELGICLGKTTKKRVLGNDNGDCVSYKLDNESIDHISSDTHYDVLSFANSMNDKNDKSSKKNSNSLNSEEFSSKLYTDLRKRSQFLTNSENCKSSRTEINKDKLSKKKNVVDKNKLTKSIGTNDEKDKKSSLKKNNRKNSLLSQSLKVVKKVNSENKNEISPNEYKKGTEDNVKFLVEFGMLNFFILTYPNFENLCKNIMRRLCDFFNKNKKKTLLEIPLLEHFDLFVRLNNKLYRVETKKDFLAAIYGMKEIEIVIKNKKSP